MTPLRRLTPATLDVLRVLSDPHDHDGVWGMLVMKATGRPAGSVYPILERLEGAGWVSSEWEAGSDRPGPRRRLYALTPDGATAARDALMRSLARRGPSARAVKAVKAAGA